MGTLTSSGTEIAATKSDTGGGDAINRGRVTRTIGSALLLLGGLMEQANAEDKAEAPPTKPPAASDSESPVKPLTKEQKKQAEIEKNKLMKARDPWSREVPEGVIEEGRKSVITIGTGETEQKIEVHVENGKFYANGQHIKMMAEGDHEITVQSTKKTMMVEKNPPQSQGGLMKPLAGDIPALVVSGEASGYPGLNVLTEDGLWRNLTTIFIFKGEPKMTLKTYLGPVGGKMSLANPPAESKSAEAEVPASALPEKK